MGHKHIVGPSIVESPIHKEQQICLAKYDRAAMFCRSLMPIMPLNYQFYLIIFHYSFVCLASTWLVSNTVVKPYARRCKMHTGKWQTIQWIRCEWWNCVLCAIVERMAVANEWTKKRSVRCDSRTKCMNCVGVNALLAVHTRHMNTIMRCAARQKRRSKWDTATKRGFFCEFLL